VYNPYWFTIAKKKGTSGDAGYAKFSFTCQAICFLKTDLFWTVVLIFMLCFLHFAFMTCHPTFSASLRHINNIYTCQQKHDTSNIARITEVISSTSKILVLS